jgi:hypothetical protein
VAVGVEDLGFPFQGKNERPPNWHHAQRLIRGIKDKCSAQGVRSIGALECPLAVLG